LKLSISFVTLHKWSDTSGPRTTPRNTHLELGLGVPDDQVGVEPDLDLALALAERRVFRGVDARPVDDLADGHAPCAPLRPEQTQPEAERADPTPRANDVALVHPLQTRDARAVVGDDAVDHARAQRVPEERPVRLVPDGRAALEVRASVGDALGGEAEVVEARLDGEGKPRGLGGADERERGRGGEVHDVAPQRRGGALEGEDQGDRVGLELRRARG
jgi:hypothetical protein